MSEMAPLRNAEIADLFDLLGDLYELDGAVVYRVLAYRKAAKRFRETAESVWTLSEQGRLTELDDIGDTIATKVGELRESGTMAALEKLRGRVPESLVEIVRLPGLGAKTARKLWLELDITTLADLEAAARDGRLKGFAGFGERKEQQLLAQIEAGAAPRKRAFRLDQALELVRPVLDELRAHPACERADAAGSLRRLAETVGDVDVIAAATDGPALTAWLIEQPFVAEVLGHGTTKASIVTHNGVQLDLRVVPLESYGNLLQHFTGSKGHNVRMREDAQRRGMSVSEWGIEDVESGEVFRTPDEDEVYRHLGYQPIPPELREDNGELELARRDELPDLVELADMRGDMHLHSDWSGDGKHPLLDVVAAVRERGHEYMAITDHSAGVGMGIGLEADDVRRQIEAVQLIRETLHGFDLLAGCEVDVMGDGSLYLPDDVLAELDWVVASLHIAQRQDSDRITKRLLSAAEHPSVDVIGHPSGRMIGKREGYAFDIEALVAACAAHGTFLEINAQPHRLDLRPAHARLALAAGVKLVISTDAHRLTALDYQELGVFMARRAGATRDDIANARPLAELNALRKPGRVVRT
ncbi:MAG: polymerase [Gaiellales bacterium]|nr:polymerase [Gaiellales bacterium]MDX6597070.1 polymerase [Gaiellales bacterium]